LVQPTPTQSADTITYPVQSQQLIQPSVSSPQTSQVQIPPVLPIQQGPIPVVQTTATVSQPQVTSSLTSSQASSNNPYFVYCDNLVRTQYPYELTKAQIVASQVKTDK
jgi:hypothetical protein